MSRFRGKKQAAAFDRMGVGWQLGGNFPRVCERKAGNHQGMPLHLGGGLEASCIVIHGRAVPVSYEAFLRSLEEDHRNPGSLRANGGRPYSFPSRFGLRGRQPAFPPVQQVETLGRLHQGTLSSLPTKEAWKSSEAIAGRIHLEPISAPVGTAVQLPV